MDALPPAHALYEPIIAEDTGDDPNATDRPSINDVETSSDPSLEYDEEFETLVVVLMKNQDRVDVNQAAMNITYTIINAGLIALPFVAYNAGIPLFIAVVVCVALLSSYVAVMVIAMANEKRAPTLEDLAEVVGGVNFFLFVCAIQVLFSLSMMVCSLDVWADVMADVFRNYVDADVLGMRRCQVLIGGLIVLPLCLFKKSMVSLRWTAYFTVFAVAACVAAVAATYLSKQSVGTTTAQALQPKSQWWTVIYVIVFCFSYNQRVFAVHRCLRSKGGERRVERWKHAVCRATVGVTAMYIIFGVAGFLSMARMGIDADQFNYFLDDQGENKIVYDVSRVVVVSSLLLTIPVDCLIASSTWRRLYQRYFRRNKSRTLPTLPPSPASSPLASLAPSTFDTDGEEGDVGKERSSLSERDERDSVTTTSTVCNRVPSREEMVAILRANSLENVRQEEEQGESALDQSFMSATFLYDPDEIAQVSSSTGLSFPEAPSLCGSGGSGTPLLLWGLCVLLSLAVSHWMYLACLGTFCTALLQFIFPSMFYFRMNLKSDYQAIPCCGIIPNRFYMCCVQLIGIAILLCDVVAFVYFPAVHANIIRNES